MLRSTHFLNIIPKNYNWKELYVSSLHRSAELLLFSQGHLPAVPFESPGCSQVDHALPVVDDRRVRQDPVSLRPAETTAQRTRFPGTGLQEEQSCNRLEAEQVRRELGPLWHWLPDKTLSYDVKGFSSGRGGG